MATRRTAIIGKAFIASVAIALTSATTATYATTPAACLRVKSLATTADQSAPVLPQREGPRIRTSGRVPHVQVGLTPNAKIVDELHRFAFSLPGVTKRATVVSLPGATGMWLDEQLPIAQPKAIVAGREFAHIHRDGSLHLPVSYERALELSKAGWGERHPWADARDGWRGLVMIYTPLTPSQLRVVGQLIAESYHHITGRAVGLDDC